MVTMVIRAYSFGCDEPDCDAWSADYLPRPRVQQLLQDCRRQARSDGWRFTPRTQCPRHAARWVAARDAARQALRAQVR